KTETDNKRYFLSKVNFLTFIIKVLKKSFELEPYNVLFVDNRKAIIPALIIKFLKPKKKVILDVRELYLIHEVKHTVGKIGCVIEKIMIKKADVLICANEFRADYMQKYFKLSKKPLVFENLRKLEYVDANSNVFEQKYGYIFESGKKTLISTSGVSVSRTNDKLVESLALLSNDVQLILIGGGSKKDHQIINGIINKNSLSNRVFTLDMVSQDELKYLIEKSDIGVVNYHDLDLNNKFCASGKVVEFIFEGKPIIATENPPLMKIVNENNIGECDNSYSNGIKTILNDYEKYKTNVLKYKSSLNIEENNKLLGYNIKLEL
ncbi:MAG: glycosyltransferase, partial [Lysinibacillus sp.]